MGSKLLLSCILATMMLVILFNATPARAHQLERRQGLLPIGPRPQDPPGPTSTSSTSSSSSSSSSSTSSTRSSSSSSTSSTSTSSSSTSTSSSSSLPTTTMTTSTSLSTIEGGGVVTITLTTNYPISSGPPAPQQSEPPAAAPPTGIKTSTIVGLSVAGGIAVLGVLVFLIWKITRKKLNDFDTDAEAIKWPELRNESHALPARPTGRAGIDTSISRTPSEYSEGTYVDKSDPYAVPPLPSQNPNQPYRDDPSAAGAFYDPYRGPSVAPAWNAPPENIPMSTYNRSHSPGPGFYDNAGRASPGPGGYPQGRQSPGPAVAYGAERRPSPGPNQALAGGYNVPRRASPGPNNFDAYGGI